MLHLRESPSRITPVHQHVGPLVTIAIPTFNRSQLLRACIDRVLAQTYPRFELLICDNASEDDTEQMLAGVDDDRLRVVRHDTNIGLLPNWNSCVEHARGDYIVILPDDDAIAPHFLERCVDVINQHPNLQLVVSLSDVELKEFGTAVPAQASRVLSTGVQDGIDVLMEFLRGRITVTMCSVLMKTSMLRERGGIPQNFPHTADVAAWAPLLLFGQAGFVNETCASFTHHNDSETGRLSLEQLLDDGWKVADLISAVADERVADQSKRELVRVNAKRCFARRGMIVLSDHRRNGGSISNLLNAAWRFRTHLRHGDPASAVRLAALLMLPRPVIDQLHRLKHAVATPSA
ncbi:MAG: glycosyltransferase [Rhodopseudomonas palustris]|nr:MAG: glycosyltransferase [Rhodopseudomonas palustris]